MLLKLFSKTINLSLRVGLTLRQAPDKTNYPDYVSLHAAAWRNTKFHTSAFFIIFWSKLQPVKLYLFFSILVCHTLAKKNLSVSCFRLSLSTSLHLNNYHDEQPWQNIPTVFYNLCIPSHAFFQTYPKKFLADSNKFNLKIF